MNASNNTILLIAVVATLALVATATMQPPVRFTKYYMAWYQSGYDTSEIYANTNTGKYRFHAQNEVLGPVDLYYTANEVRSS